MTASAIISVGCAIETSAETVTHNFYVKKGIPNKDKEESIPSTAVATSAPDSTPQSLPASGMHMEPGTPPLGSRDPLLSGLLRTTWLSPPPMVPLVDAPVKKPSESGFKSCLRLSWWCLWHVSGPQHPCLIRGQRGGALRVCSWGAATFQTNLS